MVCFGKITEDNSEGGGGCGRGDGETGRMGETGRRACRWEERAAGGGPGVVLTSGGSGAAPGEPNRWMDIQRAAERRVRAGDRDLAVSSPGSVQVVQVSAQ